MDTVNQSLLIAPSSHADHDTKSLTETANSFGVHDTLRYGIRTIESEILEKHPLENRIKHWEGTRTNLNLTMQRRLYGMHAPIRHLMERSIVSRVQRIPVLPSSNLGLDILTGKDETIDFEDFLNEPESSTDMIDVHAIMEYRLGIKLSAFN